MIYIKITNIYQEFNKLFKCLIILLYTIFVSNLRFIENYEKISARMIYQNATKEILIKK